MDVFMHTINCMIGIGLLALPHAMAVVGPVVFNIVLAFVATAAIFSTHMLTRCLEQHSGNLEDLCGTLCGLRVGRWAMCAVIVFQNVGSVCSYMHIIMTVSGALLPYVPAQYTLAMVVLLLIYPVSLPRSSRCLTLVSAAAITCVMAFVCYTVYFALVQHVGPFAPWDLFDERMRVDQCLSIITFAFVCQPTIVTTVNLHSDKLGSASCASIGAMALGTVLYVAIAMFGWMVMGPNTPDNMLSVYLDQGGLGGVVIAVIMCVSVVLTVPALLLPVLHMTAAVDRSPMQWISTLMMYVLMYVLVVFMPSFKIAVVLVGAFAGTLLVFVVPSLMYTWIFRKHNPLAWAMVLVYAGMGASVTTMSVYDIFQM